MMKSIKTMRRFIASCFFSAFLSPTSLLRTQVQCWPQSVTRPYFLQKRENKGKRSPMRSETSSQTFCGTTKRTNTRRNTIAGEGSVFADAINALLYRADKINKLPKAGNCAKDKTQKVPRVHELKTTAPHLASNASSLLLTR